MSTCNACLDGIDYRYAYATCTSNVYCRNCYLEILIENSSDCEYCSNYFIITNQVNVCIFCKLDIDQDKISSCTDHKYCKTCSDSLIAEYLESYPQIRTCNKCLIHFRSELDAGFNLCDLCKGKKPYTLECKHKVCIKCISRHSRRMVQDLLLYIEEKDCIRINDSDFVISCAFPMCNMKYLVPAECVLDFLSQELPDINKYRVILEYKLDGVLCSTEIIDGLLVLKVNGIIVEYQSHEEQLY